jgi:hypothetical protein
VQNLQIDRLVEQTEAHILIGLLLLLLLGFLSSGVTTSSGSSTTSSGGTTGTARGNGSELAGTLGNELRKENRLAYRSIIVFFFFEYEIGSEGVIIVPPQCSCPQAQR